MGTFWKDDLEWNEMTFKKILKILKMKKKNFYFHGMNLMLKM